MFDAVGALNHHGQRQISDSECGGIANDRGGVNGLAWAIDPRAQS